MPIPQTGRGKRKDEKARAEAKAQQRKNAEAQARRAAEHELEAKKTSDELSKPLIGPRKDGGDTYMARADMLELLYAQERLKHAETSKAKTAADLGQIEAAYLFKRERKALEHHRAELERVARQGELQALHHDIEQIYGLSIEEIVFDTDTGLLSKTPQ